jgi:hypothetical protein
MYLMADFARRVGSKDKKKRKISNLFTSTISGWWFNVWWL